MRYVRVKITRDVNTKYNRAVPEWEIPVLEFLFDQGNVERTETFETVDREYPEPGFEFDRLVRAYGADPQSGVPYAASVYGQERAGIRALTAAMTEAKAEEIAESEPAPAKRGRPQKSAAADPLTA